MDAQKEKVRLTKEKATLLPTLYGKALDSRSADPILNDTFADDVVRRLDFDFSTLEFPKGGEISLPVRAKHLDGWTRAYISAHPSAIVLHLGCGLDSRVCRIDPPPSVRWYDVDQADVIELRRRLYPERPSYSMVATSVTDLGWLDAIPSDGPVFVVAEGLVIYLEERAGLALFRAIADKFPAGELAFDAYDRIMTWLTSRLPTVRKSGAVLRWAIDDPRLLEREIPKLSLVESVPFLTMPELVDRMARSRLQRASYRWLDRLAFVRRLVRHLRYRF